MKDQELTKLRDLTKDLSIHFNDKRLLTLSVLIQNLEFSIGEDESKDYKILDLMQKMKDYFSETHVILWAVQEVEIILMGYYHNTEEIEND